jgi:hypothetical protein
MGVDVLPPLEDDQLVAELLRTTPFLSAQGEVWRSAAGRGTHAPTTLASWHVVPRNYDGGYIGVDAASCARCHASVNRHVNDFEPGRDWYGRVRGSDRIFSFHPFDPACISHNGYPTGARMRPQLVRLGLLVQFDATRHTRDVYQRSRAE